MRRAQKAVKVLNLSTQLEEIQEQYSALIDIIQMMKNSRYTIQKSYHEMMSFDFRVDSCQIGRYIQEKMSRNDIKYIVKMGRSDISPHLYSLLRNSQSTSASVERSFSILGKLLVRRKL